MRAVVMQEFALTAFFALCLTPARADEQNLVRNPGFEEELGTTWLRRTPADKPCTFSRQENQAHGGRWCLVLENRQPAFNRVRQGSDRSLKPTPGSLVELSAWVKADLQAAGFASVQLYCMGQKEAIFAQPIARAPANRGAWQPLRLLAEVPEATTYLMVYLQAHDAAGKVFFDDLRLRVIRAPRTKTPLPKVALVTDLSPADPCSKNVRLLLDSEIVQEPDAQCARAVVLLRDGALSPGKAQALLELARRGGRVFMDLRSFAKWRGLPTSRSGLPGRTCGTGFQPVDMNDRLETCPTTKPSRPAGGTYGLRVVRAETPDRKPALVRLRVGSGQVVAADVLSLDEPYFANVTGYYKYLLLANTLASDEQLALAEYYPRKLSYAELVAHMRGLAKQFPAIRLEEEGPACGQYRLWSLNLGRPGAPLYFLYAAAHGSEWEPGYGLMTFARRVAEGRLRGVIDLEKVAIKIVPIINPSGYDLRQRQNAHGVDLNRQGDYCWKEFKGRDSNGDGQYGPRDYDWKGAAPFSEPEARTYRRIADRKDLHCVLDFHGNSSGSGNNKVGVLPATAAEDNTVRAYELQWLVNQRLRRRYVLRQSQEKEFTPYLLERVYAGGSTPFLMNTAARGRYGLLVELTAGYPDSYGTVLQTEVTCSICRALFEAFPPSKHL